jgi:hypothetical protein
MKKLYLSITLLGMFFLMFSITLIPTQAYAYQGITIDTNITELSGYSLRDLFQLNLVTQGDFFGDVDSIGNYSEGIYTNTMDGTNSSAYAQYSNSFDLNDLYYYRLSLNVEYSNADYILVARGINNVPRYDNPQEDIVYSLSDYGIPTQYNYLRIVHSASSYQDTQGLNLSIKIRNMYVINLTDYGFTINDIDKETLDYYYNLYYLLINGLNPTEYYLDGSQDGYIEGYNDGVEDGYDDGFIIGEQQGFNEGRDDAIDNNFTLMGLIELIIGVVLSMVGWIINIEIFNISIIGILSTLAVGIGLIWLLKILRG